MTPDQLMNLNPGAVVGKNGKKYIVVYIDDILGFGMKYGIIRIYNNWTPTLRFIKEVLSEDVEKNYNLIKP